MIYFWFKLNRKKLLRKIDQHNVVWLIIIKLNSCTFKLIDYCLFSYVQILISAPHSSSSSSSSSFLPPPSPLPAPASLTHFPFFPLVFPPLLVFPLSPLLPLSSPSSLSPPPVLLSLCRHLLPSPPLPSFPSLTSTSSALPSLRRVFPPFRCFCFLPSFCPSSASPLLFPFSIVRLAFAVVFAIVFALVCLTRILALAAWHSNNSVPQMNDYDTEECVC